MNKYIVSLLVVIGVLGLTACQAAPQSRSVFEADKTVSATALAPSQPQPAAGAVDNPSESPATTGPSGLNRMIIYNVSLDLVVQDTAQAIETVQHIIQTAGGYLAESNTYRQEGHLRAALTARVPSDKLANTLGELKKVALTVESETLTSQDVTDQYTDLQSHLRNLQASEQQYLEIMKRADKIEDVLAVQHKLTETRGQIEEIQGRIAYLSRSATMATLRITLMPDVLAQPIAASGWRPAGTAKQALDALVEALRFLADTLIWSVICILPVALLIGMPLYLATRWAIWRLRRPKASPKTAQA